MDAPLSLGAVLRHLSAAAALVALLPLAAAAQPTPTAEQERAYAAAQAEYEVGHYAAAYNGFAALADAGHSESARVAMQMHRNGPGLYQMRFGAGPKQIGRWTALLSCPSVAAASTDACRAAAGTETAAHR